MKVTEHLKKAKETLFSYEILPPLKGASIQTIYDTLDELTEFKPPFIDVRISPISALDFSNFILREFFHQLSLYF